MKISSPTPFGTPDVSFGTAVGAGSSGEALRTDDTLLLYDTTVPENLATSASVGTSETAARRDHKHPGIPLVTSTNEAITRFDGTVGIVQNYTSLAPTVSDDGIVSLTSGALKWPATAIASADPNTLDDYQEGNFTPGISDNSNDSSEASYTTQVGRYVLIGRTVIFTGRLEVNSLSGLVAGQTARIMGLPFVAVTLSGYSTGVVIGQADSLNITSGTTVTGHVDSNTAYFLLSNWDAAGGTSDLTVAEFSDGGRIDFAGQYTI